MRTLILLLALLLNACSTSEPEVLTTSVDVDEANLEAMLRDIDALTDNALPLDDMIKLAAATPMDDELQKRFVFAHGGSDNDVQIHVWREQADWVHVYFSSTSKELLDAIDAVNARHARASE